MHTFCTPAGKPCFSLHCLHSVHRERIFHSFSGEQQPRKLAPLFGIHLSDDRQHHFGGDLRGIRQIFFCRHRAGFVGTNVLRIEVGFQLFSQFQPGLVLCMGVGVHQDARSGVASVALHSLDVAARFDQLVGGTGMAQTVELPAMRDTI